MADDKAKPGEEKPKGDDKGGKPEKKEKKSLGQILVEVSLAILFVIIFVYVLNAFLGILFPGTAETLRITGSGLQQNAAELMRLNVSLAAFMTALFAFLVRILLIIVIVIVSVMLVKAIVQWAKSKGEAPAH